MAISPVSSVSFNSYNNISFESRKNRKHPDYESGYSTSPLKAIPLAALIAMSPMVDTYAQSLREHDSDKIVQMQTYKNPVVDGCNILYISNDGDDSNVEAIALQYGKSVKYNSKNGSQKVLMVKKENSKQFLNELKTVNITYKHTNGKPDTFETCYVVSGDRIVDTYIYPENDESNVQHRTGYDANSNYKISKELYDYLKQFMEDESIKTENKTVTLSDDFNFSDLFPY